MSMPTEHTFGELAALVGGSLEGDPALVITGIAGLEDAQPGEITFVAQPKYLRTLKTARASAVILDRITPADRPTIRVDQPYRAFAILLAFFYPRPRLHAGIRGTRGPRRTCPAWPGCCAAAVRDPERWRDHRQSRRPAPGRVCRSRIVDWRRVGAKCQRDHLRSRDDWPTSDHPRGCGGRGRWVWLCSGSRWPPSENPTSRWGAH